MSAEMAVRLALARALGVSTDELLGLKTPPPRPTESRQPRLWKLFQRMAQLPERDQRAVLRRLKAARGARRPTQKSGYSLVKAVGNSVGKVSRDHTGFNGPTVIRPTLARQPASVPRPMRTVGSESNPLREFLGRQICRFRP